ncbi:hypothetical protein [Alteribacillus sp. YIM 98480]|uniref:hypothetical protein n=1 Tax=Alteribacillus sp. YIM 98480 TaxID=2606599 RepID=UPI00131EBAC8|nr:hypothetical protein [Alteribacillus sp. YIM 98480]
MFKWMPHKEQEMCERKLNKVMKRLKIENFNFNWDRSSCFIEFSYQEKSYKMEHSVLKAKKKGIILRNGLDCLLELIRSLEDLSEIIDRGTYKLEIWLHGMKQSSAAEEIPEYEEEFHIRYKTLRKQKTESNRNEDFVQVAPEASLRNFNRAQILQRSERE